MWPSFYGITLMLFNEMQRCLLGPEVPATQSNQQDRLGMEFRANNPFRPVTCYGTNPGCHSTNPVWHSSNLSRYSTNFDLFYYPQLIQFTTVRLLSCVV